MYIKTNCKVNKSLILIFITLFAVCNPSKARANHPRNKQPLSAQDSGQVGLKKNNPKQYYSKIIPFALMALALIGILLTVNKYKKQKQLLQQKLEQQQEEEKQKQLQLKQQQQQQEEESKKKPPFFDVYEEMRQEAERNRAERSKKVQEREKKQKQKDETVSLREQTENLISSLNINPEFYRQL